MNHLVQAWVPEIVKVLLEHETENHKKQVNRLIEENNELQGVRRLFAFVYLGTTYGRDGTTYGGMSAPSLHETLQPTMNHLLLMQKQVAMDRIVFDQAFPKLLRGCHWSAEVRNALPECVVVLLPALREISRSKPEAWTLQDNPRALKQWQRLLPKIETYCMGRLLY